MGTYRIGDEYYHAIIDKDDVMKEHMSSKYCVINEVSEFKLVAEGKKAPYKMNEFYPHDKVEFTNLGIVKKCTDGKWTEFKRR
jgi:hypothetical protein